MAMLPNGTVVGDGSWVLNIHITDLNMTRQFRVKGDMHIGGVMLRLVEDLDVTRDWSDHALWWPQRNRWLTHTRSTLDQRFVRTCSRYGVSADALLHFTPMHKLARIQLPDLQYITSRLNFSVPVFNTVIHLCKELGIRHPEEMSFKRYIPPEILAKGSGGGGPNESRKNQSVLANAQIAQSQSAQNLDATTINITSGQMPMYSSSSNLTAGPNRGAGGSMPPTPSHNNQQNVTNNSPNYNAANYGTMGSGNGSLPRSGLLLATSPSWDGGLTIESFDQTLIHSPRSVPNVATSTMLRPKNYPQKAALNAGWLDSSRSLLEQGINENDLILLRFKFLSFFDLNPKYDPVRINQIYEQARWAIFMEEFDCTEEEAFMFAALQLQVQLRTQMKQNGEPEGRSDDVDLMLNELECTLEGTSISVKQNDITDIPELADYLKFFKPRKLTLKSWKRAFFTFKDLSINWYDSAADSHGPPSGRVYLKGAEVSYDVSLHDKKFNIKLMIPSAEGMSEFWIRCDSEQQYARWLAGCKLAAKGKTMADSSYHAEVETIRRLLAMQHPAPAPVSKAIVAPQDFNPEEFLPSRFVKKLRTRQYMVQRILEAHANVNELNLGDSKLEYIRAWQALPEYGVHYFVVRFRGVRKPDLLSIAYNRMMRMNLETGETVKTWRFSNMKTWHVNWEIKHIFVKMEDEDLEFSCLSADCKVPHEFIGGYIFLSLRSKDQNQVLNEELFHKLTGGWQ